MLCIAMFLLCGKDRRARFFHRFFPFFRRFGRKSRSAFAGKPLFTSSAATDIDVQQRQGLLESGNLLDPIDFELDFVDGGAGDEDVHSDDSNSIRKGHSSGWNTPRLRVGTPKLESTRLGSGAESLAGSSHSLPHHAPRSNDVSSIGLGMGNALDRPPGLAMRTESRESLRDGLVMQPQQRSRSRRGSPNRTQKPGRSPLVG